MLEKYFLEFILIALIGCCILLMILGDIAVIRGRAAGHDIVARAWLRGQTALLIGILLGRLGKGGLKNGAG